MVGILLAAMIAAALAQEIKKPETKKPGEAEMMAMLMELAKPGEQHRLLQDGAGTWDYSVKWWMNPEAPPAESTGTTVLKSVLGGRYLVGDHTGKMKMPGPDGQLMDTEFKGMSVEGYDNAKRKYVASWIDNMGTGIMHMEGTYDAASKKLTYLAEYEMVPGVKSKMREVITLTDKDHRIAEFFEERAGKQVRTMEIRYTRRA
jgi:Protein of unknown function (DUF1579)